MIDTTTEPLLSKRARLTRLGLRSFRNHGETTIHLEGRHVCLFGANGAGKTNILEAVSMLSPGRGLRSAEIADMAQSTPDGGRSAGWAISADLDDGGVSRRLNVEFTVDEAGRSKRSVKIDGAPTTQNQLGEIVRVLWITPAMDRVFAGPAGDRRRFFDRQVMAHFPAHGSAAAQYEKAMRQRNALFEQGRIDEQWAGAVEAKMAETGAAMASFRSQAMLAMQAAIDARPDGLFPKADLALAGRFEAMAVGGADAGVIAGEIAGNLRGGRARDAAAGRTLEGVHRTDLKVVHRPKGLPAAQCSTGEQKALLMGLVLANAQALFGRDFAPNTLLLLDEAAAHLDSQRRAALYDELVALGGQAWLTGTDQSLFEAFGSRAEMFEVTDGAVCPV